MKTFEFTDEQVLTIITALGVLKDRIGQKTGWLQRKRMPILRGRLADCITIGDPTLRNNVYMAEIAKQRRHDQFIASQNYLN